MPEFVTATTVGQLRAALTAFPDHAPVMLDSGGLLQLVQEGEAGAGETRGRTGFVDDVRTDATPVRVVWLIGEAAD